MTTIDVDTSPLQAAREWRGIGRVAAALSSGLPMAQAEALETGDIDAFDTVDEMIAAAVVYGASLGIGRDEAMALLDRTVSTQSDVSAQLPEVADDALPAGGFSSAVRERSARMATRPSSSFATSVPLSPLEPMIASIIDEPTIDELPTPALDRGEPVLPSQLDVALPPVPTGPTPEQAVEASQELHLGAAFPVEDEWEVSDNTGELEAWASGSEREVDTFRGDGTLVRVGDAVRSGMERVIGTDRSDQVAAWASRTSQRVSDVTRTGRERLRRSEHATLIVAIGAGAVLIALLVAVGGALGGGDDTTSTKQGTGPDTSPQISAKAAPAATGTTEAASSTSTEAAKATPMVAAAQLKVNVYNAGSRKGYAKTVAAKVRGLGYGLGTVGNAKSPFSAATIVYPAGLEREARLLGRHVGVSRLQQGTGAARELMLVVT